MKKYILLLLVSILTNLSPAQAKEPDFSGQLHLITPPRPIPALIFEDENQQQHALRDYRGRIVILNIWATWCGPCVHEMPALQTLQKNFDPKLLIVLPLSEDRNGEVVDHFYHSRALSVFPIAVDHAGVAPTLLNLRGVPTTLILDAEGQEIARLEGATKWDSPEILDFLKAQLTHPPKG